MAEQRHALVLREAIIWRYQHPGKEHVAAFRVEYPDSRMIKMRLIDELISHMPTGIGPK